MPLFLDRPWHGGRYALLATPTELGFPIRLVNASRQRGIQLIGELVQRPEAEVLQWPNMGQKSVREAKQILELHSLELGTALPDWDTEAALDERHRLGRSLLRLLAARIGEKSQQFAYLEDELSNLIEGVEEGRNVSLLIALYGFDGTEPKTLEAVGQKFGLTRERVRQLGDRAKNRLVAKWHDVPRLTAAIGCIRDISPAGQETIANELQARGITRGLFYADAVLEAAALVDCSCDIERMSVGEDILFSATQSRLLIHRCIQNFRKATSASGCTSVERLALQAGLPITAAPQIRRILESLSETEWLDDQKTWAMSSRPTRNRLLNYCEKVFAAARKVELGELRRSLSRPHRSVAVPPAEVLAELLEIKDLAHREGDFMAVAQERLSSKLSGIEEVLLEGFQRLGSPLSREELESYCIDQRGLNPTSFYIYLAYTPIITKLMPGVYALVGAEVSPGSAEQVRAARIAAREATEHGWTPGGELWMSIPLDRLAINACSRVIPGYVAELAAGQWKGRVAGGLDAGELTVENGFLGGLRDLFALLAPEPGDRLLLVFDLQSRNAEARLGGNELNDLAQLGHRDLEDDDDDGVAEQNLDDWAEP